MTDLELKINALKEMNAHVIEDIGDEDIIDYWIEFGVPDEANEEDYRFIAENWDSWIDTLRVFTNCLKMNGEM